MGHATVRGTWGKSRSLSCRPLRSVLASKTPNQDAVGFILFIYSTFVLQPNSSLFKSDLCAKREAEFSASLGFH